jgi:hypothetical protein
MSKIADFVIEMWKEVFPQKAATVTCIDTAFDMWGERATIYWRGKVPVTEILEHNPRGSGGFHYRPPTARYVKWAVPAILAFVVAAGLFAWLNPQMPPGATIPLLLTTMFVGAIVGTVLGFPLGWLVKVAWFSSQLHFFVGRVPVEVAKEMGLQVTYSEGAKYALIWAVPPSWVLQTTEDGGTANALVAEAELSVWGFDSLLRGEDGYTNELLIRALAAQGGSLRLREDRRSQPVSMDRAPVGGDNNGNGR